MNKKLQMPSEEESVVRKLIGKGLSNQEILETCRDPSLRLNVEGVKGALLEVGQDNEERNISNSAFRELGRTTSSWTYNHLIKGPITASHMPFAYFKSNITNQNYDRDDERLPYHLMMCFFSPLLYSATLFLEAIPSNGYFLIPLGIQAISLASDGIRTAHGKMKDKLRAEQGLNPQDLERKLTE